MDNFILINVSASIMIGLTFVVRKLAKKRVPHMVFMLLWLVIGLRLLVPYDIESPYSFYNIRISDSTQGILEELKESPQEREESAQTKQGFMALEKTNRKIIWCIGSFFVGGYFIVQYRNTKKEIKQAVALQGQDWIGEIIEKQRLLFPVALQVSQSIASPAVFGTIKPKILFPRDFDFSNKQKVEYIVLHECGHLKYFHFVFKILSMVLVSLYWYNPFVWILYLYLERDMEISGDRYVLKKMIGDQRANYAMGLVSAAREKKQVPIFYYHYKKNFMKERVEAIMYFKKLTLGATITAILIPMGVVSVFATSDVILTNEELEGMDVQVVSVAEDATPVAETVSLALTWSEVEAYASVVEERAATYFKLENYKYSTYGVYPPKTINVTVDKNGNDYSGTLTVGIIEYDPKTDKYTGYYNGTVYLR